MRSIKVRIKSESVFRLWESWALALLAFRSVSGSRKKSYKVEMYDAERTVTAGYSLSEIGYDTKAEWRAEVGG